MPWYVLAESAKKRDSTSAKLKIFSKIFLKKASPLPPIEYLKSYGTEQQIVNSLRSLKYKQVAPILFSVQVNIDVTVGKQMCFF